MKNEKPKLKIKNIFRFFFVVFIFSFFVFNCRAQNSTNTAPIIVNEICWMGSVQSANDEWIELFNNSANNQNIDGWVLKTEDNGINIKLKGEVPAMGFFLLERTDDNSVPNIKADLIYQGALSNNGEILKLIDSNNNIVDEVDCSSGWFAGDNKTKQTMERTNGVRHMSDTSLTLWQTSQNPGGTPKATNNIKQITNNETSTTSILSTSSENAVILADRQGSLQKIIPNKIATTRLPHVFISEVLPSPEGSDTENEFIEIFNANNFEANVSGFKIKDKIGGVKTFTIPAGTKISANGFLAFKSSQTKISLNNTGDGVELFDPSGKIINSTDFGKSQQGQSWSKNETGWQWSIQTTPNQANVIVAISTNATSNLNTATSSIKNNLTANIQNYPAQRKNFLAVGIATIIALSSALIAWRIKKNSTEV